MRILWQSPQFWPIPTRTTVLNRCTAAIRWAGYEFSANQQLFGLQVVFAVIGQNCEDCNVIANPATLRKVRTVDQLVGVLLIPEFCPAGQRQTLKVNTSTLLV